MPFDTSTPFDQTLFDIGGEELTPPTYDGIFVSKWFSTAINQNNGSNTYKLMQALLSTSKIVSGMHQDISSAGYIGEASGAALDFLGDGYGVIRQTDESDDAYRLRIPLEISSANSCGTIRDLQTAIAYMLGMDPDDIYIDEHVVTYPQASISVRLLDHPTVIIDWSDVDDLIQRIKAAGVLHISAEYDITDAWVSGDPGWGNTDSWGGAWPA